MTLQAVFVCPLLGWPFAFMLYVYPSAAADLKHEWMEWTATASDLRCACSQGAQTCG